MSEEQNTLSPDVFEYLKEKAPVFLRSYAILAKFYETMTNDYTHKLWKDGRIVLTPITNKDDGKAPVS